MIRAKPTEGAELPLRRLFPTRHDKADRILKALCEAELVTCLDPDAWKSLSQEGKPRRFVGSLDLVLLGIGSEHVRNAADYFAGRYVKPKAPAGRGPRVTLCPESRAPIPGNVREALAAGTGLAIDPERLAPILATLEEPERRKALASLITATGGVAGELRPWWDQKPCGRLYANNPPVLGLPRRLKPHGYALRDTGGRPLWYVDFNNFELRLPLALAGVDEDQLSKDDIYTAIGDAAGLSRTDAKAAIIPILHGRQEEQIVFNPKLTDDAMRRRLAEHQAIMDVLRDAWPWLPRYLRGLGKLDLQRAGSAVFHACLAAALEELGCAAGIPWHDGWLFAAAADQAERVPAICERVSCEKTGVTLPVDLVKLTT